ncbi:hypothetical protein LY78DRAFT_462446 [Colletotrichum sublineola]|nr:hypothetical protein LY78DRAFT_462446 [Colletotrichum sublineola]
MFELREPLCLASVLFPSHLSQSPGRYDGGDGVLDRGLGVVERLIFVALARHHSTGTVSSSRHSLSYQRPGLRESTREENAASKHLLRLDTPFPQLENQPLPFRHSRSHQSTHCP